MTTRTPHDTPLLDQLESGPWPSWDEQVAKWVEYKQQAA